MILFYLFDPKYPENNPWRTSNPHPQGEALRHVNYFELKATEATQAYEKLLALP